MGPFFATDAGLRDEHPDRPGLRDLLARFRESEIAEPDFRHGQRVGELISRPVFVDARRHGGW